MKRDLKILRYSLEPQHSFKYQAINLREQEASCRNSQK